MRNYAEFFEWIGDDFDSEAVDVKQLTTAVARLAKAWSNKHSAKSSRRR